MRRFLGWWNDIPIWQKLYLVVGMMTLLIAAELFALRFAMGQLSAARAFVGGESMWSKAQKNAVFSLIRFGITKQEHDYQAYLEQLKVPEGDHLARMELMKAQPDFAIVNEGFAAGRIHADDIQPMVDLLRRFYWISYLSQAIAIWAQGDEQMALLKSAGQVYHDAIVVNDAAAAEKALNEIKRLNDVLTVLEEDFSEMLGKGSRWLEHVVLVILTLAVLTVESIGLTITFLTSRGISHGLRDLTAAAHRIGEGDFDQTVTVRSRDEIGQLAESINKMGHMLRHSYGELEERVEERTLELQKMAVENARLYQQAQQAVESRDEFLSIASHELKTPLTALFLQLQRLSRLSDEREKTPGTAEFSQMATTSMLLARKLTNLLNELLDLTRLRIGKFSLHRETCDLVQITRDVITQLTNDANRSGCPIHFHSDGPVTGQFDRLRMSQVVTNLLSNAIKYGGGKPIDIQVRFDNGVAIFRIRDEGQGIPPDQHDRIFDRFERGPASSEISGLGLGLYISHQIVKAHGGKIGVESIVGSGSTFTVWI